MQITEVVEYERAADVHLDGWVLCLAIAQPTVTNCHRLLAIDPRQSFLLSLRAQEIEMDTTKQTNITHEKITLDYSRVPNEGEIGLKFYFRAPQCLIWPRGVAEEDK